MSRKTIATHMTLLLVIFFFSCQRLPVQPIIEKDGRRCGEVAGDFRARWWNYFERGQSYARCQLWKAAAQDYRKALSRRSDDNCQARTYGMNFVEYFPHRELGISLYHRQRYEEAMIELETSLSQETSAKAEFYLDRARKAWILSNNLDHADPEIQLSSEMDTGPTNAFAFRVEGMAMDDTYVKQIRLNGRDLSIDLAAAKIPFDADIPLQSGSNRIHIEAVDILGNTTELELYVFCDHSGPLLNFDTIQRSGAASSSCRIKGVASDSSGILNIHVNGEKLAPAGAKEYEFQYQCVPGKPKSRFVVTAEDGAGNVTTAVVDAHNLLGRRDDVPLLAANGPLSRHILDPKSLAPAWVEMEAPADLPIPVPSYLVASSSLPGAALEISRGPSTERGGRNYALIVGINEYETWPRLKTAVNDARQLARVLLSRYGFAARDVTLLLDQEATEASILDALLTITASMEERDNLLVYFAGHGKDHPVAYDGYWIPVAGKRGDAIWTWIAHSAVHNLISSGQVRGKNIIVVTDSCYGGRLTRGGQAGALARRALAPNTLLALAARKSRQIISSGSLEQVPDWGRDGHSLFAYYLLRALKENREEYVSLSSLVNTKVWEPVNKISGQRPVIGRFKTPMDEDGEFVLHLFEAQDTAEVLVEPTSASNLGLGRAQQDNIKDDTPPTIAVKWWDAKQTVFLKRAYIEGHVFDQGSIAAIRINGHSVLNRSGMDIHFNQLVKLELGDNPFVIEAWDKVGNRSRSQIHIYRKQPDVDAPIARMSAVMLPLETMGENDLDIQGALFDYLDDSQRFSLRYWTDPSYGSALTAQAMAIEDHLIRRLKEQGIDCTISGRIRMHSNILHIRIRVVALADRTVLAKADVYGESINTEKIQILCKGLVNKILRDLPVVEGRIARIRGNKIVINRGNIHGLKNGMSLILFEEEEIFDPETGQSLGTDRIQTAQARIDSVQEKLSHAVLTGGSQGDIAEGQKVITK
jgi:uncharacterized caspase-like protein